MLEQEGIVIKRNATVNAVQKRKSKKMISYLVDGKPLELSCEEILLASGRTPNTQDLCLTKAGVKIDRRAAVRVNRFLQTSQQHIYSVGDVVALPLRLEPIAGREGTLAAENALTGSRRSLDYGIVPSIVFTDPQLAMVGLTEDQQMSKMGVCACRTIPFSAVPKAIILGRTEGMIKMVVHPQTGKTGTRSWMPSILFRVSQPSQRRSSWSLWRSPRTSQSFHAASKSDRFLCVTLLILEGLEEVTFLGDRTRVAHRGEFSKRIPDAMKRGDLLFNFLDLRPLLSTLHPRIFRSLASTAEAARRSPVMKIQSPWRS